MSEKRMVAEIRAFVNICFTTLGMQRVATIAKLSGLSVSTVYRLGEGRVSLCTHIGTVQKLGRAAGFHLELTPNAMQMRLVS
jgi:hypothetical protein